MRSILLGFVWVAEQQPGGLAASINIFSGGPAYALEPILKLEKSEEVGPRATGHSSSPLLSSPARGEGCPALPARIVLYNAMCLGLAGLLGVLQIGREEQDLSGRVF